MQTGRRQRLDLHRRQRRLSALAIIVSEVGFELTKKPTREMAAYVKLWRATAVYELVEAPESAEETLPPQAIALYCKLIIGGDGVRRTTVPQHP
jgi:hypothetical protein